MAIHIFCDTSLVQCTVETVSRFYRSKVIQLQNRKGFIGAAFFILTNPAGIVFTSIHKSDQDGGHQDMN